MTTLSLRTGAWYGDELLQLPIPDSWSVRLEGPRVPEPMDRDAIATAIRSPVAGSPLTTLAGGARRPMILVDDLTRPTPAADIIAVVLGELASAGIASDAVSVVLATGSHGPASRDAVARKIGPIVDRVRVIAHDDLGPTVRLGRTSFGSRIEVNPEVAQADIVIGIGGIYPQYSAAFGGGAKLVLGVLGRRSIEDLHFSHQQAGGHRDVDNPFRRDVSEMARRVGLAFSVLTMVDADRRVVWVRSGDPFAIFGPAIGDARSMFSADPPGASDVVISNAYPMDVSATSMRSKGILPLHAADAHASRILIAACSEGLGHHGLFPLEQPRGVAALVRRLRREARYRPAQLPRTVLRRLLASRGSRGSLPDRQAQGRPIVCYVTSPMGKIGSDDIPGMRVVTQWSDVLEIIAQEQGSERALTATVYPASPLQLIQDPNQA